MSQPRVFLFLQGPISPFFKLLGERLESMGHRTLKVNLNLGDQLMWPQKQRYNYRGSLKNWPSYIASIYQSEQVTDVLLLGEQRDYHRIAIELAKQHDINVVVTDFGYLRPDWITFEYNGMSAESLFPRNPNEILALAKQCEQPDLRRKYQDSFFNQAFWDVLYHFMAILGWPLYPGYDNFRRHNPVQDYLGILVRLFRRKRVEPRAKNTLAQLKSRQTKYFVYPLQLQHDYSIQAYSAYSGNEQPMEDILRSFASSAPHDSELVIKIHPLDPSPFKWRKMVHYDSKRLGIKNRVHFMDGGDLNQLLDHAQGVITINSTTGIQSLQKGVPTKILGNAIYDIEGLVDKQSLDEFWNAPQPPNEALRDAFLTAIVGTIQLKGTYYLQPGLDAGVKAAAIRLDQSKINQPLTT